MTTKMTERTLKLRADVPAGKGETTTEVSSDPPAHGSAPDMFPRHAPPFIPRDEAYYWTHEWQHYEAEALGELERGEGRVFHDPTEAARWLRSPED